MVALLLFTFHQDLDLLSASSRSHTHLLQLYPVPSTNVNNFCKKLLFREEMVRTESRKVKTILEVWQKCSKKPFSGIISIYKYVCCIKTGHSFKDIFSSSSLAQILWKQKTFPWISSEPYWNLPGMGWSKWTGQSFLQICTACVKGGGNCDFMWKWSFKRHKIQKNQLSNKNAYKD